MHAQTLLVDWNQSVWVLVKWKSTKKNSHCQVLFRLPRQPSVELAVSGLIASLLWGRAPKGLFVKFNGKVINLDSQSQATCQEKTPFSLFFLKHSYLINARAGSNKYIQNKWHKIRSDTSYFFGLMCVPVIFVFCRWIHWQNSSGVRRHVCQ